MGAHVSVGSIVRLGGETPPYYENDTTTASYVQSSFGMIAHRVIVINDSDNTISVSLDGSTLHGELLAGEEHEFAGAMTSIYVKSAGGSDAFRIWAW